jgi:hypothetical protein
MTGPKTVIAGFGAGVTESLLAVTPFESIKTQLSVLPQFLNIISLRAPLLRANKNLAESMTANRPNHVCVGSFTVAV